MKPICPLSQRSLKELVLIERLESLLSGPQGSGYLIPKEEVQRILALLKVGEKMASMIEGIYDDTEACADGAPDASDVDRLCLNISTILKPYIRAYTQAKGEA